MRCCYKWSTNGISFPMNMAEKAGCLFQVVSSVSGKFGDLYNTNAPSSCVFDRKSRMKPWPGDLSHNPLVTLCVPDDSRCGTVRILRSLAQPSRHLLCRSARFDNQGDLAQRFWQGECKEILPRVQVQEISHRDLAKRSLSETLRRDLA